MAEGSLDPFGDLSSASSSDEMKAKPARKNMNAFTSILRLASSPAFERGMKALDKAFNNWLNAEKKTTGGGSGADQVSRALSKMQSQQSTAGTFQNFMGGFTGSGGVGKAAGYGAAAQGLLQVGTMGLQGIDNRINSAYGQMLSYDKLAMVYQQTQGITQNQFAKNILQPMSQYKLGTGGASALLGLQASTGLSAQGNAASVAGLRAATGYAYSTNDMAQMMRNLASPMVNNRMTMTLGTGMYGPGGSQRNMMQVMQQVVRGAGLTNERVVNSGMQIGSVTRARLAAYGIGDENMQDMILNYAKSNIQYQKKGGTGMYDPNNPQAQKLMGIKKNFANEQEETQRVQEARDMQFYKRQNDNYAQLERNTQGLIKAFGALEDKLSGIIGTRTSMRNNKGLAIGKSVLGGAMVIGGGIMAATGVGAAATPFLIGGGAAMLGSGMKGFSGDPMPVGKKDFSIGYSGKRMSLSEASNAPSVAKLNPKFRERLLKMVQDNPAVGIGQGYRDANSQRRMFLDRYNKTDKKTDIFWEGSYWEKKNGVAPAAPPGFSMHEIGLAADLTGDLDWVQKNAAKYGLKTFGGVNGEPWHVQPAELPNGRGEYEKSGAKWGMGGSTERSDPRARIAGLTDGVASDSFGGAKSGGPMSFGQMSIMDSLSATREANRMGLGASGVVAKAGTKGRSGAGSVTGSIRRRGKLKPEEVAQLLYSAGFRGDDLAKALAISFRESNHNASAYNGNAKTKDKSYGLFQINMSGSLGPSRMKSQKLRSYEDLYDAETNIRVLRNMYNWNKGHGRDPFYDWGPYKGKDPLYGRAGTFYPKAQAIAKQMSGDPAPVGRSMGGGSGATFVDGGSITIHAPISINTGTGSFDPAHIGQEAGRVIERQLRIELMRKN